MLNRKRALKLTVIPIEIKLREFHSQLLLALELVSRGHCVVLGSHAAIFRLFNLRKFRASFYIDKGSQVESITKNIRVKTEYMGILDQELSPILEKDTTFPGANMVSTRFYPRTERFVDFYFTSSSQITEDALKFLPKAAVIQTGWPRFDLLHNRFHNLYLKESQRIRAQYGNFDLFVSNFSLLRNLKEMRLVERVGNFEIITKEFDNLWWQRNFDCLESFVHVIRNWRSLSYTNKLIIRPHLTESVQAWEELVKDISDVEVVKSGDIYPWLLAAKQVLHRGSTVSLQSVLLKKPTFFIQDCAINLDGLEHPLNISTKVNSEEPPFFDSKQDSIEVNHQRVVDYLGIGSNENFAIKIIGTYFDTLESSKFLLPSKFLLFLSSLLSLSSWRRALGLLKDELLSRIGFPVGMTQWQAIPRGITSWEARKIVNLLQAEKTLVDHVKISQLGINIIAISNQLQGVSHQNNR